MYIGLYIQDNISTEIIPDRQPVVRLPVPGHLGPRSAAKERRCQQHPQAIHGTLHLGVQDARALQHPAVQIRSRPRSGASHQD